MFTSSISLKIDKLHPPIFAMLAQKINAHGHLLETIPSYQKYLLAEGEELSVVASLLEGCYWKYIGHESLGTWQ